MTRYPSASDRYAYRCKECEAEIPDFQGLHWFTRERPRGDGTVDVPYCAECGAEAIEREC
jgi:DNA-directed RNA polymerase subunit RPC12/RpoP